MRARGREQERHLTSCTHLVEREVLQKRSPGGVRMEDAEHFLPSLWEEFLGVP
jgi:hypothetical protein